MTLPILPAHRSPARQRLLVVDDQPANVQALYQALSADYRVLVATSGEQALRMCRDEQPDLVLLDIVMPGLDGYAVCQQLKSGEGTQDIPVIFVTASTDEASETRGLEVGAVDFIAKPINPAVVRARVKTHLTLKLQADMLRQLVYIDGLTGVFNRRGFEDRLAAECRRSTRNRQPLSVALIDVDHFKRYNDRHGHQAGDDCLRRVARALAAGLNRPGDLLARYGGEEFACLLPETHAGGALEAALRLEQQVRAERLLHGDSSVGPLVTVSIGVATSPSLDADAAAELLSAADRQLYRAKELGRGRVCAEPVAAAA